MHPENWHWARPADPRGTGVLVVAGSSGRIDAARADLLASHGVTALAIRWFGGPELPDRPCEVPLEIFVEARNALAAECDRVVFMGLSYGAEASLLTAAHCCPSDPVVALSPTDVAWEGQALSASDPLRSKWTLDGHPLPFLPLDRSWQPPADQLPSFVDFYTLSRDQASADTRHAAAIPVENILAPVVLIAGGDDKVWDSLPSAQRIKARRDAAGRDTRLIDDPRAGHPIAFPGEPTSTGSRPYLVGGDDGVALRLGTAAWPHVARLIGAST